MSVLAIDAGTTGVTALDVDEQGALGARGGAFAWRVAGRLTVGHRL